MLDDTASREEHYRAADVFNSCAVKHEDKNGVTIFEADPQIENVNLDVVTGVPDAMLQLALTFKTNGKNYRQGFVFARGSGLREIAAVARSMADSLERVADGWRYEPKTGQIDGQEQDGAAV